MLDADAVINNSSQKVGGSNAYPDPAPIKVGGPDQEKHVGSTPLSVKFANPSPVCLSAGEHISGSAPLIFTKFYACYPWQTLGPPLVAMRYTMYFRFMDDVLFAHNGQNPGIGNAKETHSK